MKTAISKIFENVTYGTLALSENNQPYSIPLNFVAIKNVIYFHGAKTGKKINIIKFNNRASFSIVEPYSIIPSYFSSDKGQACSATQYYISVIVDGFLEFVSDCNEKRKVLEEMMKKFQPEKKYINLDSEIYKKSIQALEIIKLIPEKTSVKIKTGQNLNSSKFDKIIENLELRNTEKDKKTIKMMKKYRQHNKK